MESDFLMKHHPTGHTTLLIGHYADGLKRDSQARFSKQLQKPSWLRDALVHHGGISTNGIRSEIKKMISVFLRLLTFVFQILILKDLFSILRLLIFVWKFSIFLFVCECSCGISCGIYFGPIVASLVESFVPAQLWSDVQGSLKSYGWIMSR